MARRPNAAPDPGPQSEGQDSLFQEAIGASDANAFADGEGEPQPQEGEPPPQEPEPDEPQRHHVPLAELLDERDRRQAAEGRLRQIEEERQRQQTQPDYLVEPDRFTDQRIQAALDPIRQQFAMAIAHQNRATAAVVHGEDAVAKAQALFDDEVKGGRLHPAEHQRVMQSPNPFLAAVEWHRQREMLREVGNDPAAYKKRLLEEALNDPEYLGRAIEAARAQAQGRPITVAPRAPARASAPPAAQAGRAPLPPSLNRSGPPGGAPAQVVMDDGDLYDEMTNPGKVYE